MAGQAIDPHATGGSRGSPMAYSAATVDQARQAYVDGTPVEDILAATGMRTQTLYRALHGRPVAGDGRVLAPIPLRRRALAPRSEPTIARQSRLVQRIWRAAETQVREIENRFAQAGQPQDSRERDARMLAILVKTLRELSAMDTPAAGKRAPTKKAGASEDDDEPRDLDEFRRDLARRMDAIVAARSRNGPDEP